MKTASKITSISEISNLINTLKSEGKKIVFTNGCFDILHLGHIDYLEKTAAEGDFLVLGLNSDSSVKRLKGEKRPINNEEIRAKMLAALSFIDAIILFEEDTPFNLIQAIKPNILIKGGDYLTENIVGADIVQNNGGVVKTIPFLEGFSTTSFIEQIKNS